MCSKVRQTITYDMFLLRRQNTGQVAATQIVARQTTEVVARQTTEVVARQAADEVESQAADEVACQAAETW